MPCFSLIFLYLVNYFNFELPLCTYMRGDTFIYGVRPHCVMWYISTLNNRFCAFPHIYLWVRKIAATWHNVSTTHIANENPPASLGVQWRTYTLNYVWFKTKKTRNWVTFPFNMNGSMSIPYHAHSTHTYTVCNNTNLNPRVHMNVGWIEANCKK